MKIVQILLTTTMEGCQYLFHKMSYLYVISSLDPRFYCSVKTAMTSSFFFFFFLRHKGKIHFLVYCLPFFFNIYFLAALGLSHGTRDLSLQRVGSLVVARKLSSCGTWA